MADFNLPVAQADHQTAKFNSLPNFPAIRYWLNLLTCVFILLLLFLSQGFQLVFDPPHDKSLVGGGGGGGESRGRLRASGLDSVFSLHQAINEQREAIYSKTKSRKGRRHGDITAKFSLGRVFHKVELTYPDLVISIYKSK